MFGRSESFGLKSPKEGPAAPGSLPAFSSCYNLMEADVNIQLSFNRILGWAVQSQKGN